MLAELRDDNTQLTSPMREAHNLCDEHGDVATASLLENWIDEAERRDLVPVRGQPRRSGAERLAGDISVHRPNGTDKTA